MKSVLALTALAGIGSAAGQAVTIPKESVSVGGASVSLGPTTFTATEAAKTFSTASSASATVDGVGGFGSTKIGIENDFTVEFDTTGCEPGDVKFSGSFGIICEDTAPNIMCTAAKAAGLPSGVAISHTIPKAQVGALGNKLTIKLSDMAATYGSVLKLLGADVDFNIYLDKIYASSATSAVQIHSYVKVGTTEFFNAEFWVADQLQDALTAAGQPTLGLTACGSDALSGKKCFLMGSGTSACGASGGGGGASGGGGSASGGGGSGTASGGSGAAAPGPSGSASTATVVAAAAVAPLLALAGTM